MDSVDNSAPQSPPANNIISNTGEIDSSVGLENYGKLKRRFHDLEEEYQDVTSEAQRSVEKLATMQREREYLLERIRQLEEHQTDDAEESSVSVDSPQSAPQGKILPRMQPDARVSNESAEQSQLAVAEAGTDDQEGSQPSSRRLQRRVEDDDVRDVEMASPTRLSQDDGDQPSVESTINGRSGSPPTSPGSSAHSKRNGDVHGATLPTPTSATLKRPRSSTVTSSDLQHAGPSTESTPRSTPPSPSGRLLSPSVPKRRRRATDAEPPVEDSPRTLRTRRPKTAPSPEQARSRNGLASPARSSKAAGKAKAIQNEEEEIEAFSPLSPQPIAATASSDSHSSLPPTLSINTASSKLPDSDSPPDTTEGGINGQKDTSSLHTNPPTPPSTSDADPNIDPSLVAQSSSVSTSKLNSETTTAVQSSSSTTQNTSTTPSSSGSTSSVNPYLNLFLPSKANNGTPTPTSAHAMFSNPYMFYGPLTPVTPGTPSYPYNPYLYMPMMAGMYASPGGPGSGSSPPTPNSGTHPRAPPPPPPASAPVDQSGNSSPAATPGPSAGPSSSPQPPAPTQSQPPPKPKRHKTHIVTSKSYSIPIVPRDKNANPMLPLNVGIMTVISLGTVCLREQFHTERYIFPVGYEVTRRYLSTVDPTAEVVYHCAILDGGDGPKFQIVPSDTPAKPVIAGTATGAWSSIVKQANAIRNRNHSNSVSGPDFFGLGQNTIKHLIQGLPNADRLKKYVWQHFIEGGPLGGRHASVIPALPEEFDASMPRGAVYHSPLEREKLKLAAAAAAAANGGSAVEPSGAPVISGDLPKGLSHYPQHIIAQAQGRPPHHLHPQHQQFQHPHHQHQFPHPQYQLHHLPPHQQHAAHAIGIALGLGVGGVGHMGVGQAGPGPATQQQHPGSPPLAGLQSPPPPQGPGAPDHPQPHSQAPEQQHPSEKSQDEQQSGASSAPPDTNARTSMLGGQAPTPITPNTPAPSIASIMNAYRPAPAAS
ncbi:hypothetical protein FA15DRAFT_491252 [Coprinopsis marcescibilis]|uniref:FYR N-terminal domain-containing protein n=1 Tax=Coprinopsis marcescibilis TaxID=230819 RepID=A0A5C3KRK0_COPMA|nr:hypothetical protein FA15DRAFT_491252 [Coprinopsis marcescibilis]